MIIPKYSKPFAANRVSGRLSGDDRIEQNLEGLTRNSDRLALRQNPAVQRPPHECPRLAAQRHQAQAPLLINGLQGIQPRLQRGIVFLQ